MQEVSAEKFESSPIIFAEKFESSPIIFGDFIKVGADSSDRLYEELADMKKMKNVLDEVRTYIAYNIICIGPNFLQVKCWSIAISLTMQRHQSLAIKLSITNKSNPFVKSNQHH